MTKKLIMLTAYDYPTAKILDEIGIDYILVGDSVGMVVYGYPDTKSVTMTDMVRHVQAVARGAKHTPIIADLPINTYNTVSDALLNAKKLIQAGAYAVKVEGRKDEIIRALQADKIPVVGHVGLLPQTALHYKVQGRDVQSAEQIYEDAKVLDGFHMPVLILECIPQELAKKITRDINTPTIGIGAGKYCDGQVLVLHDVLGLSDFQGKFVRQYFDAKKQFKQALLNFKHDVFTEKFPEERESFQ